MPIAGKDTILRVLCILVAGLGVAFSGMSIYYYYDTDHFTSNTDHAEWLLKLIFSEATSPVSSAAGLFVAFGAFIESTASNKKWFAPLFRLLCILGIVTTEIARFWLTDPAVILSMKTNTSIVVLIEPNILPEPSGPPDPSRGISPEKVRNYLERAYDARRTNFIVYTAMMLGMKGGNSAI